MSWGQITATSVEQDSLADKLANAVTTYENGLAASDYELDASAKEQIEAAVSAATALVASGAVGKGLVNVSLNGHANPDHKPAKGWANDVINVSVSCADPQPTS